MDLLISELFDIYKDNIFLFKHEVDSWQGKHVPLI